MPLYEYRCQSCEEVIEVLQKLSDAPKRKCGECGGRLEKLVSASGFVLKGGGWYVDEYGRSKSHAAAEKNERGDSATKAEPKADPSGGSPGSKPAADATSGDSGSKPKAEAKGASSEKKPKAAAS